MPKKKTPRKPKAAPAHRTGATERIQAEEALAARARRQAALAELGLHALTRIDLATLMDDTVALLSQVLDVDYCKVLELLPDGKALLLRAGVGWKEGYVGHATVDAAANSQAGYTLLHDEPVVAEDLRTETRFSAPQLLIEHGVVSGMSVIIKGVERPFGVLGVHTTRERTFSSDDINFLQAVANVLAAAIERKQAEEALRTNTERLLKAQAVANMGFLDWNLKTNDMIWSDQIYDLYGVEREAQEANIGLTMQLVHPDDLKFVEENLEMAKKGEKEYDIDHRKVRPDGTVIWVHARAELVRDADGNPESLLGTVVDITQRKQAEEALRQSEANFRMLVETTAAASFIVQGASIRYANSSAEAVTGYTREELLTMNFGDVIHPKFRELVKERGLAQQRGEQVPASYEVMLLTKTGEERWVDFTANLIDFEGEQAVLGTAFNITERKRLEEELQQAREELEGRVERKLLQKNPYRLTFREFTVLHHVAAGKVDKEIAHELGISPLTVHKHVANILGKMNASSRTEAAARALRDGLVD